MPTSRPHIDRRYRAGFSSAVVAASVMLLSAHAAFAADPSNLTATVAGSTVTFRWDGDGSLWVLEAGSAPGLSNVGVIQFASTTRIRVFSNVPPGTYYVRVRAIVGETPGPPSNEVVTGVGCSWREFDLRSTINGRQVQLAWNVFGGQAQQGVQLEAGTAPGLANVAVLRLPSLAATFSATAAPGTYYVRVRSIGLCGAGPPSNEVQLNFGGTNCVPTLSPFQRSVFASGTYTGTITVPSGCAWDVFTRDPRWITVLTPNGTGSGTIQYRVTLPGGGTGQLFITTTSGRYFVHVVS